MNGLRGLVGRALNNRSVREIEKREMLVSNG